MAVDRDKVLQAAQKLVERKRYDKAIEEYKKLVAEDPRDARTLLKIGDLYAKLEQYPDAIGTYERVGQFYSAQGFAVKAIAVYKQIRELIQKHVPHLEDRYGHIIPRLAEIYTQLGLTSDALAAYDEMATRLQRVGRDRDALDVFKKVVELDPNNPLPYLRLADAFMRVKDMENAVLRYGTAAEILLKLGRRDDTLKVLEQLLRVRPDPRFARMAAEIYLDRGAANDGMVALTKLQICFKDDPKDLDTLALLSRAFDKLAQPAKAIEVQKESARIAKEAGRLDAYNAIVDALLLRAPQDEAVRQLAAHRGPPGAPSILPPRSGSIEVEVDPDDVEVVEDEAPFALRQSQPPPRMQPMASAAPSEDPAARMRQALTRAEAHRRAKQYDQAVATLEAAVRELPVARELHEKLCDLLIESGDQDAAIRQMLTFADVLAKQGDVDGSARLLDEVLLLEPNQGRAMEMLRALGYSVPSEGYEAGEAMAVDENGAPYVSRSAAPTYDPEGPLPAYDLDDAAPAPLPAFGRDLDDPFTSDEPLPSYPIEDEATRYVPPVPFASAAASIPPAAPARPPPPPMSSPERISHGPGLPAAPPSRNPQRAMPAPAASQRGSDAAQLDEDALEEVEFFTSHGMFDEARAILDEQLSRLPNHPLLLERRRELDAAASGGVALPQESGARILPRSSIPDAEQSDDRSFDIAASLDALDALDALEAAAPAGPDPNAGTEQVSVEAVFEQFKAGVAAQISPSDAATHYDLGVAYREMGLYADAIEEFKLASRDPGRECVCWSMIGWIQIEMGTVDTAIDSFVRGLKSTQRTDEHEVKLNYEVGNAYEMRNSPDHALYYFQRVARIDPHYYDPRGSVDDRIARLAPRKPPPAGGSARAVGAEHASDEFDAAFDDLLSRGGKLP